MSDLSNLLGDVYGGHDPDAPPVRREPSAAQRAEVPAWADESRLDAVFADWQPGPAPGAPAVERDLMSFEPPPASSPLPPLDDDLAAALSAALVDATTVAPTRLPASPPAVVVAPAPSPAASAPAPAPPPAAGPAVAVEPRVAPTPEWAAGWTASTPVMAPPAVAGPPPQHWEPGDDDIVPRAPRDARRRGGRRR